MARPERNNVDYFPFICKEGKSMYYIEHKYGNDGFATWIKILRMLAVTDYHFINLSNDVELMYLAAKCKISEDILKNIIKDLCSLGEIDSTLWNENKVLFSQKFIDNIQDAYNKRNNKCITLEGLRVHLLSLGILNSLNNTVNTHSIVKDIKEKDIIEDIEDRKLKFANTLKIYIDKYGREMLLDFYSYWTEPNKSKTKFRQELQKTWDLERRILTWVKNDKNFNKKNDGTGKQNNSDRNKSDLIALVEMARRNVKEFEVPNGTGSD